MGNGLFRLLTTARLSDTSEMPLWKELWQFFEEKYFHLDLTEYAIAMALALSIIPIVEICKIFTRIWDRKQDAKNA